MTEREDVRTQIASRLEKLRTLDKLAEEMPGSRQGSGWDPSKIAEAVVRVVPQHLDRLVRKAIRPGIFQRVADSFRPVPAMSRLAGPPMVIYFPLWYVRGYHECFYLREANYQIRVDKDVVAVEVDGETRDLMIEEQETTITIRRDEDEARIYTCDETFKTKMAKTPHKPYKTEGDGLFYKIPKGLITIRSRVSHSTLSKEQRKAVHERLSKAREAKNAPK